MNKIFICTTCGNLVEMLNDSGQIPTCCGNPLKEVEANTVDAAHEKHVPVIESDGNIVIVTVGETKHPMIPEHYIEWIYLQTNKGLKRAKLMPNMEPTASFILLDDEVILNAYAYCNLHGLWKK